jgi:hypothetical protein
MDGDGFADIVVRIEAENEGRRLAWYEYPNWDQHVIAGEANYRGDDIELADMDNDEDLDIIAILDTPGQVYWYENPRPEGNATNTWTNHHYIGLTEGGSDDGYVKDIEIDDFNGDGKLDVVARTNRAVFVFRQETPTSWANLQTIDIPNHEGMDVGDLDGDGDPDVVLNGFWLETPTDPANDTWVEHNIDSKWWTQNTSSWMDNNGKVHVADMNKDGRLDVLLSHSEKPGYPVSWYEASDPKNGPWTEHVIDYVDYCHTLKAADMDNDGDLDVVTAEMPKSSDPDEVIVFINAGDSLTWTKQVVAITGNYSAMIGDIGSDGDMDIVGCQSFDSPPIELWENKLVSSIDHWTYIQVDDGRAGRAFGLAMGDLTGDGYGDIVSGPYFYRNPGGDMTGPWSRVTLPNDVDAQLIVDVDGDALADIIAENLPAVYWLEATDLQGSSWSAIQIGTLPETGHHNGQGYALAQIVAGGKPEILLPGGTESIYYFEIPTDPSTGNWPRTQITNETREEGIGVGDIDGDGDNDIAARHDVADGWKVAWWENPGNGTGNWTKYIIGSSSNRPDRFAVADINRDGRLDIVMSEETPLEDASVYWFEQPTDPKSPDWTRHTVVTQYTTNSMDVADMDKDGDIDIITGEHRGTEKVAIWENVNDGSSWVERVVSEGRESHLGARVADLDGDGDLEIASIAWDDYQYLHLWRNDAPVGGTLTVAAPTITPNGGTYTHPISVTLATSTSGASIYYTTDGSEPITTSTLYSGALMLTSSATLKARAFRSGYDPSNVASASFIISTTGLRVIDGQQVLYTFREGRGTTVYDASGTGTPLNLGIENGTAASWLPGRGLVINSNEGH